MRTVVSTRLLGTVSLSLAAFAGLASGCGSAPPPVESAKPAVAPNASPETIAAASCKREHPGQGAVRADTTRQSSSIVLARSGDRTIAYVADEDARAVRTIDVDSRKELARTPLDGAPSQILVLDDGRVAAAIRDKNRLQVLEPVADVAQPLASRCSIQVAVEPIALAQTPDDKTLLVTSAWARMLTAFEVGTMKKAYHVPLPREPRAVVVEDGGQRAFVSHVVNATLTAVDLTTTAHETREVDLRVRRVSGIGAVPRFGVTTPEDKLRSGCQGFALAKSIEVDKGPSPAIGEKPLVVQNPAPKPQPAAPKPAPRIFAPMVTVEPGDPNVRSPAYYGDTFDGVAKEAPIVSVVDAAAERALTKNVMSLGTKLARECMLPRAATVRASTGTLFVACQGIDSLVELDTRGLDPARLERHRWEVPAGPTGVAIDDKNGRAVVWSQFSPGVSVIDLAAKSDANAVKVAKVEPAADPVFAAGRRLYHTTDDKRISSDGSSCESCHPEGREDAITWATPDGPRQTIMLAGRLAKAEPYGWLGKHGDLKTYVQSTFTRLGGSGIPVNDPDYEALIAYVERMAGPNLSDRIAPDAEDAKKIAHGKDLFFASEQGCATCHIENTTDKAKHDVGSKAIADEQVEFDTPSLLYLSGTAPYFHDGRYQTLDQLLVGSDGKMGHTMQLSKSDMEALKAYLESL